MAARTYGTSARPELPSPGGAPPQAETTVPCWLCGATLSVRVTRSLQPYLTCLDCGLQMFIRSSAGAQRLERLARPNRTTHQEEVR